MRNICSTGLFVCFVGVPIKMWSLFSTYEHWTCSNKYGIDWWVFRVNSISGQQVNQGRRKFCKSEGERGESALLVEIGLTDLENSGGGGGGRRSLYLSPWFQRLWVDRLTDTPFFPYGIWVPNLLGVNILVSLKKNALNSQNWNLYLAIHFCYKICTTAYLYKMVNLYIHI